MKIFKALISIEILIGLIWILNSKIGRTPAFGKLFSPTTGFWYNIEAKDIDSLTSTDMLNIHQTVTIRYDSTAVPHVFAANDYELYFSQGYITAKDRLWQMDLEARTAAGNLAEALGPRALQQDRYFRNKGLLVAAEKSLKIMEKDPVMKVVLNAYADGVNAYVHQLKITDYPIEFKIFNYAPDNWTPVKSILVFKLMAETLSGGSDDFAMSNTLDHFGDHVMKELFPDSSFLEDPVMPRGTSWPFRSKAKNSYLMKPDTDIPSQSDSNLTKSKIPGIGSNNWAVAGTKTKSGFPILANDPHLSLSMPSIWYQIQLVTNELNVYGVSIPGIPCVIIGFNQKVAWGLTNAEADLVDWYSVRFNDRSKTKYWYKNKWNLISRHLEEYKIRGEKSIVDTVLYTHQGPIMDRENDMKDGGAPESVIRGFALHWTADEPSEEIKTFYLLNRAMNFDDYRTALTYYGSPPQNFIFASQNNDIAITSGGKYPLRFRDQGKFVLDGSEPANDWHGWIPAAQNPFVKNPLRGFVSSANQSATDSTYPYYLSWEFGSAERAHRINSKLQGMRLATTDTFRELQNDNYSVLSDQVLTIMLSNLNEVNLERHKNAIGFLKTWDHQYNANSIGAKIFDLWWNIFYDDIWRDDFGRKNLGLRWPTRDRTVKLFLEEPSSHWFDDLRTPQKENSRDILNRSFHETIDSLRSEYGPIGKNWCWGASRKLYLSHMANVPAFNIGPFSAGGSASSIDALTERTGPSWRMVVELGPEVHGYGVFPGGESGNPGSKYYDNFFASWKSGQLRKLIFLKSKNDYPNIIYKTLLIK